MILPSASKTCNVGKEVYSILSNSEQLVFHNRLLSIRDETRYARFEIQKGYVIIDDTTLSINESATAAVERWYRERRYTVYIFVILVCVFGIMFVLDTPLIQPILTGFSVFVVLVLAQHLVVALGIYDPRVSSIPRQSIVKAQIRPMGRLKNSKVTIVYTSDESAEDEAEAQERAISLANPVMNSGDGIEQATKTLQAADIDVDRK